MNNYNELIRKFEKDILRDKSLNTAKAYIFNLNKFLKYLNGDYITEESFQAYIDKLKDLAPASINQHKVAINSFIKFIGKDRMIIKSKGKETLPVKMVKEKDYKELVNYTKHERNDELSLRYKCMLMLGGECGLRASEVLNLRVDDIDLNILTIQKSKRNKTRKVPISKKNLKMLEKYIKNNEKTDKIFFIKYITLSKKFTQYCDMLGLKEYTFHGLRHMCATRLLEDGHNPKSVADFLGDSVKVLLEIYGHTTEKQLSKMALDI